MVLGGAAVSVKGSNLRSAAVWRWARTGSAGVLRFFGWLSTVAATAAGAAALSLAGQWQPLQIGQVHACQTNCGFEIFLVSFS